MKSRTTTGVSKQNVNTQYVSRRNNKSNIIFKTDEAICIQLGINSEHKNEVSSTVENMIKGK